MLLGKRGGNRKIHTKSQFFQKQKKNFEKTLHIIIDHTKSKLYAEFQVNICKTLGGDRILGKKMRISSKSRLQKDYKIFFLFAYKSENYLDISR